MPRNKKFGLMYAFLLIWELGFFIIIPLAVFIFLGLVGDRFLGTHPVFLIVGVSLGMIAGFYGAYRALIPFIKNKEKDDRP
ncbi:MAG: AtpZ/AtpI family protein [Candidatus Azambacteria bacterium]|nr:AtpZ/AtpI family protein [Candidatus Azambacteria bacterium]